MQNAIINKIESLAKEYQKSCKKDCWEATDSEEFGYNEFISGKAEAYADCVRILKSSNKQKQ